jgi:hypothetical protein
MRLRRITWRPHVALWLMRWLYSELVHKGARVEVGRDTWEVRW